MSVLPPPTFVLQHVCDIIQTELDLLEGMVFIYNQKINVPSMSGLFVAVGVQSLKMIGVTTKTVGSVQTQSANVNAVLTIDMMSKDLSAFDRKEEVIMALTSTYAQQLQEKYGFLIARHPLTFNNLSDIEGAAIPYRFQISVQVQYAVTKQTAIDYFDQFSNTISTDPKGD